MTNDKPQTTNYKWKYCFGIVLMLLLFLVSCGQKDNKPLEIVKVERGNVLAQLPASGNVTPRNRLAIKPPVAGRVEEVKVNEGQRVKKGAVLAWMSSNERAALLDAASEDGEKEIKYWQDVYKPAPIIAPLDGFIIKRIAQPGQYFSSSEDVLVMADKLIVESQVDETDIGRIKLRQKADIVLDAYPNNPIPGYVEQIAYESQTINNVTVYTVKVLPCGVPPFFRAGMSATINFVMEQRTRVLRLPLNAVKKKGKRSYVFVKNNGDFKTIQIQPGLENNNSVEILSGLAEGDEVVIPTAKMVKDYLEKNRARQPINIFGKKKN